MLTNNIGEDITKALNHYNGERLLNNEKAVTKAKIAEMAGTSPQYLNRMTANGTGVITKTFVKVMEELGYDVTLTYTPINKSGEKGD